jgi:hypothetical protein
VLRDILADGYISAPTTCPVLNEEVIYAFYGRAAYRSGLDFEVTSLASMLPVVLILDPTAVPAPKYVFPFDSGAFVNRKMDQHLHRYMPLFDFLLPPDPASAAKLVNAAFGGHEAFFRNIPLTAFNVPASNFEADSYRQIVLKGAEDLDDRSSTPELVFAERIELDKSVRAIILPDVLEKDPHMHTSLRKYKLEVLDYPFASYSRPNENHFKVRQLVEDAYLRYGWLS